MPTPERVILTLAEAAELLQTSVNRVKQMIADGRLTGERIGARSYVNVSEVEAFIERRGHISRPGEIERRRGQPGPAEGAGGS
jgi:excisionase family DNA binding protein